ncbi:ABC-type branched-chain amino acid transport system, permease component [Desulfosporosinus acidiphilus SJ4]|uniref:ABC-type branched-chain amino acid transport system, permease component n=1 Tax=Desulfosporosinus acidiphilus (strain DSM 22704 / JCM 16185 / SJ4) TaxID=646529 RepID=I4D329_DESAJ|nr:branched-chain amino acid ABC transporter permease [Desulfosporosinus acidiphilus]AFM40203.1 ABC-type branched-chain amino acid transport system, permease component [Desulfosporosinus acidiphilus SJ4]
MSNSVGFKDRLSERMKGKKTRTFLLTLLVVIVTLLPLGVNNYVEEVMTNTFFYIILALGLNIVIGYAGLVDLGYAAFFAVGAYTTGILMKYGLNFWLTIPIAVIFCVIAGIIIGGPTLRLRSDYLAIVTLGFGEITRITARNLKITGGASGLVGIQRPSIFGHKLYQISDFYYTFFVLVILAIIVSLRIYHSRLGRAWQYIREDEDAAEAMGIDPVKTKLYAYMIGAAFGGVAGAFFAVKMTAISPETFAFTQSAMILLAVILGGMGKIPGAILGAVFLVFFPEIFREIGQMRMLLFGILLVIIMVFRPQGLWPERKN